jgi:hypothetical protein
MQQFISKLSDKEKKIFYITILVIAVAALDRLLIAPGMEKLVSIKDDIVKQERTIKADMRILAEKDNIVKSSEMYSKYFVDKKEPNDVVNRGLLSSIEKLASQSKVTLIKSNPSDTKEQKRLVEYYAKLDCIGELQNVIAFMHSLNASDDLLKVVQFNLVPKKGSEKEVSATMTVVKLVMTPSLTNK